MSGPQHVKNYIGPTNGTSGNLIGTFASGVGTSNPTCLAFAVPEPAILALITFGLAGVGYLRRRSKRST